jgi:hypothetical protein
MRLWPSARLSMSCVWPGWNWKRAGSFKRLRDGKIADYSEVANVGPAFVELGFAPERTAKILAKEGAYLKKQPAFKRHLG